MKMVGSTMMPLLISDNSAHSWAWHAVRRTAVRNLIRAGVTESVAMTLTGHQTRSVFDRYNIISSRDLQYAATLLNKRHRSQESYG